MDSTWKAFRHCARWSSAGAIEAVVSLRPEAAAPRSGAADYRTLCRRLGLPLHEVDNINHDSSIELLRRSELDLVFVIGWTQILKPEVLRSPVSG